MIVAASVPSVFKIAETKVSHGMMDALRHLGVSQDTRVALMAENATVSDSELLTEFAGKLCYMSFDTNLNRNLTRAGTKTNANYIETSILENGHGSVLEHSSVTLLFADVSRVLTHELVRHRVGTAFSQVSGRYVRTDVLGVYVPRVIQEAGLTSKYLEAMETIGGLYDALSADAGVGAVRTFTAKKILTSALRRLLPNGQATHILVTANHRAWRHIIAMRTDWGAEEEIRMAMHKAYEILSRDAPSIYPADLEFSPVSGIPKVVFKHSKV